MPEKNKRKKGEKVIKGKTEKEYEKRRIELNSIELKNKKRKVINESQGQFSIIKKIQGMNDKERHK